MVAQVAPAAMPHRQYSQMIIGGLWPLTDPATWSDAADVFQAKAADLMQESNAIRQTANGLHATGQRGDAIDGFVDSAHDGSNTCSQQSEDYGDLALAAEEVGRTIYGLREDLDRIDSAANEEIQRLIDEARRGGHQIGLMATLMAKINEVIGEARTHAAAATAAAAAHITSKISLLNGGAVGSQNADTRAPSSSPSIQAASWDKGSGAAERGGMPESPGAGHQLPQTPGAAGGKEPEVNDQTGPLQDAGGSKTRDGEGVAAPASVDEAGRPVSNGDKNAASANENPIANFGGSRNATGSSQGNVGTSGIPSTPVGSTGSAGGGFGPPSTSGLGQMGSTGSGLGSVSPASGLGGGTPASGLGGGTPASGLSSPGGLGTPSAGGGGAPAGASDFTRGFNAGAASGGAPLLPPPAAPQPSPGPAAGSGAPAGAFTSGPAQVSTASGAPTAAPMPATGASAPVGGTGGGGMPGAPMGALPPFNSDVPRPAPTASVTPASGPAVAPSAPAPSGGTAPSVTALPPGVMGSGVGAAAGAGAGLSSPVEDPQLAAAAALVYELAHASRLYGTVDWCVGVFKTPAGAETVVVGNEGAGFIPRGVFVPRSARMLFCDSGLGVDFRRRWFAWANPAQTMLAYTNLLTDHNPNIELYALATSTDHGGSALPAQAAGVPHYEDCSLARSPIPADANPAALDEGHAHRLETLDRGMYARLTGVAGSAPDRSEAWTATVAGVRTALERAASIKEVVVPPEIRAVLEVLSRGEAVATEQWQALEFAGLSSVLQSASQRPGHGPESGEASPFARAYHNLARAAELLLMWTRSSDLPFTEIAYTAAHVVSEAQLWPAADR